MRLFVGVTLSDDVVAACAVVVREIQRRLDPRIRAAWIADDKMHLTVRFIGHADTARVPGILAALEPPLAMPPFEVVLAGCGAFPSSGAPRVFWIGLRDGGSGLQAMHDEFNRRLRPLGFVPEDRPFNPHLTIARIKDAPRDAARAARATLAAISVPPARCRIERATVFESRLSPKGSTYVPLLRVPCQPAV